LDDYLVAQYAFWAGDYDYAQERYSRAAGREPSGLRRADPPDQDHADAIIEDLGTADDLLVFVANSRERRIADKRRQFQKLASGLPADSSDLVPQPLVLRTSILRGAVWRLSARQFAMRAYVTVVKSGYHVLDRARDIARERGTEQRPQHESGDRSEGQPYSTALYEWEDPGNPFLSIVVTGLVFIEVTAFWTGRRMPTSFTPVQERLQAVLDSLSQ